VQPQAQQQQGMIGMQPQGPAQQVRFSETLHPEPCTLNPAPCTLNPAP